VYGIDRIAQISGTIPEYFLTDGLGSVRQLVDSTGTITLAKSYEPYGETISSAGGGVSVYQFTGEARDPSGLTYLRARYLDSNVGRFISRDIWAGDYNRPLSLNRWLYVEGNPIIFSDPSGYRITEGGVNSGLFIYSCRCGWIDVPHANPDTTKGIFELLKAKVNLPSGTFQDRRVLNLNFAVEFGSIPKFNLYSPAVVKNNTVASDRAIALGMLMGLEERREFLQSIPGIKQLRGSGYSEEDLTSDIIGYYLYMNNLPRLDNDVSLRWLAPICGFPEKRSDAIKWSQEVFGEYGEIVDDWKVWALPRSKCSSKIDEQCGTMVRFWPPQFSVDFAQESQVGGDWWWYFPVDRPAYMDLVPTDKKNIYGLRH
jgi:RHS repeat-associated protein